MSLASKDALVALSGTVGSGRDCRVSTSERSWLNRAKHTSRARHSSYPIVGCASTPCLNQGSEMTLLP